MMRSVEYINGEKEMRRQITVVFLVLACAWFMAGCEEDASAEVKRLLSGVQQKQAKKRRRIH